MTERHISFTTIREVFNEYEVEKGLLYLRIKPVLSDIISEVNEGRSRLRFKFMYVSRVIKSSEENVLDFRFTSSQDTAKKNKEKELEFRPVKEIINIYQTEDEDIILVAYVLDNEGNPILGFTERNFVDVVPKPDRSRTY
jgi:hypothetical protein